ncbi:MAG: PHP domain-containing protein [Candidatus Komeilibacteria bacterium]
MTKTISAATKIKGPFIDLQFHSHFSDGSKSPTELAKIMHAKGVGVAALTDHNTVHGQYEFQAACKPFNIKVIPAVEIYARYKKYNLHILGYNIDLNNAELHDYLRESQVKRKKMIESLVPLLKRRSIKLDISVLFSQPATYIGMVNIIRQIRSQQINKPILRRLLKKNNYDYYEIYNAIFSRHQSTHLSEVYLPLAAVVRLIKRCGGVPVIAHPGQQLGFEHDQIVPELKRVGVEGIECFSSHHNWDQTAHYIMLAGRQNMIITGGSDYHGDLPGDYIVDNYLNYTSLPLTIYQQIKKF